MSTAPNSAHIGVAHATFAATRNGAIDSRPHPFTMTRTTAAVEHRMQQAHRIAFALALAASVPASGFEAWGFKSGMSAEQVEQLAAKQGYVRRESGDLDVLIFTTPDEHDPVYVATFCRDGLNWLAFSYKPTITNVVDLVDSLTRDYGQPTTSASTTMAREGPLRHLSFTFPARLNDTVRLVLTNYQSETAFGLQVEHGAKASCIAK